MALGLLGSPAHALAAAIEIDAGSGQTLRIERSPLRVALVDQRGRESVGTPAGREGPPLRLPGIDGPQPAEPLGALGGFPAFGFVLGAGPSLSFPVSFFQGNRLFGAETGVLVSATDVEAIDRRGAGRVRIELRTDLLAAARRSSRSAAIRMEGCGSSYGHRRESAPSRPCSRSHRHQTRGSTA